MRIKRPIGRVSNWSYNYWSIEHRGEISSISHETSEHKWHKSGANDLLNTVFADGNQWFPLSYLSSEKYSFKWITFDSNRCPMFAIQSDAMLIIIIITTIIKIDSIVLFIAFTYNSHHKTGYTNLITNICDTANARYFFGTSY